MSEIVPQDTQAPQPILDADPLRRNLDPIIWPECGDCREPYELRRAYSLSGGMSWAWFRPKPIPKGCRHKAAAVICWDPESEAKREAA